MFNLIIHIIFWDNIVLGQQLCPAFLSSIWNYYFWISPRLTAFEDFLQFCNHRCFMNFTLELHVGNLYLHYELDKLSDVNWLLFLFFVLRLIQSYLERLNFFGYHTEEFCMIWLINLKILECDFIEKTCGKLRELLAFLVSFLVLFQLKKV